MQTTQDYEVEALVIDSAGQPLAGVEFGDFWHCENGRMIPGMICNSPDQPESLVSDAQGRVRGLWTEDPGGTPLLALNPERTLAARVFAKQVKGKIVLTEAVTIRLSIHGKADRVMLQASEMFPNPEDLPWSGWEFTARTGPLAITLPGQPDARFRVSLRTRVTEHHRTAVIEAISRSADLGTVAIAFSPLELPGEVLPDWHADAARGVHLERSMPCDFRGRPLIVQFREHGSAGPERWHDRAEKAFYQTLAEHPQRERFQVLFLDIDPWGKTRAPDSFPQEERFPVLTDWSGKTEAVYGPLHDHTILLDAEGRLVITAGKNEYLLQALEAQLALSAEAPR